MIKDLKVGVIPAVDSFTEWTLAGVTENFVHHQQMMLNAQKSHIESVFMWITIFCASLVLWCQNQCFWMQYIKKYINLKVGHLIIWTCTWNSQNVCSNRCEWVTQMFMLSHSHILKEMIEFWRTEIVRI
jgi:hypothetical protein